jgi:uncharacterized protein
MVLLKSMIPEFPFFKKLALGDKDTVESFAHQYPSYSTFNFTNIWSWDTKDTRMVTMLNKNLVFMFTDYDTDKSFLTYLGKHKPSHTVSELITYAKANDINPTLRFIPEFVAKDLNTEKFSIELDTDNSDYIFSTKRIADSAGNSFKSKRILIREFLRKFPNALFEVNILDTNLEKKQVFNLLDKWKQNKSNSGKEYNVSHEEIAISRLLDTTDNNNVLFSSVSIEGVVVGFSIDEVLPNKTAMAHFVKADVGYKGIYEYLNEKTAGYLALNGIHSWNWQQDLGLVGLRKVKISYRPITMLHKYKVSQIK